MFFDLVFGFAGHLDAEAFVELYVLLGYDDREVGVRAAELVKLLLSARGKRIGERGNGESDGRGGIRPSVRRAL